MLLAAIAISWNMVRFQKNRFKIMIQFVWLVKCVDKKLDTYAMCTKQYCGTGVFTLLQETT